MKKFYIYLALFLVLTLLSSLIIYGLFFSLKSANSLKNPVTCFSNREDGFSGGEFLLKKSKEINYSKFSSYKDGKLNGSCVLLWPYKTDVYEFKDGDLINVVSYDISGKLVATCSVKDNRADTGTFWYILWGAMGIKSSFITHWKNGKLIDDEIFNKGDSEIEKLVYSINDAKKAWESEDISEK